MIPELTADVEMPLGVDPNNDFSAFTSVFAVQTSYGLSAPSNPQSAPPVSESLVIRIASGDPAPILHAPFKGTLLYVPGTSTQSASLRLEPLPLTALALVRKLPGSGVPKTLIYDNVVPSSVTAVAPQLLHGRPKDKRDKERTEFLAGARSIIVDCGSTLGRADTQGAPAGFRLIRLTMKMKDGLLVNPAYYFSRFPEINAKLAGHPLLTALLAGQHHLRFPFSSTGKRRYVAKFASGSDGQFLTPSTASASIQGALNASQDGDVVVVLDTATYAEKISTAKTVQIISTASLSLQAPPSASDTLPKLTLPSGDSGIIVNVGLGAVGVSGFRIEGGKSLPGHGAGILIQSATGAEVANNHIHANEAFKGGGIAVTGSVRVSIAGNRIDNNRASGTLLFDSVEANRGQGGGVFISGSKSIRLSENVIVDNEAGNFGGGVAVMRSTNVSLRGNKIGDEITHVGNRVTGDSPTFIGFINEANPRGGGGGIGVAHSEVSIVGNRLYYNGSSRGGGIEMYALSRGLIEDNWIEFNTTRTASGSLGGDGGGIAVNPITTTFAEVLAARAVVISRNHIGWNAAGDDGGGVYGTTRAILRMSDNDIYHNTARLNGGGVRVTFGAILGLTGGTINDNTCNTGGATGGGGGLSMLNSTILVRGCKIQGNQAANFGGGGVYGAASDYSDWMSVVSSAFNMSFEDLLTVFGFQEASLTLIDCKIPDSPSASTRNSATAGGGLYIAYRFYPFHLVIKNTFLGDNVSTHQDPAKSHDIVMESTDTDVVPAVITNPLTDPLLATSQLRPLVQYDRVFDEP